MPYYGLQKIRHSWDEGYGDMNVQFHKCFYSDSALPYIRIMDDLPEYRQINKTSVEIEYCLYEIKPIELGTANENRILYQYNKKCYLASIVEMGKFYNQQISAAGTLGVPIPEKPTELSLIAKEDAALYIQAIQQWKRDDELRRAQIAELRQKTLDAGTHYHKVLDEITMQKKEITEREITQIKNIFTLRN